jgi:hypothetical protein
VDEDEDAKTAAGFLSKRGCAWPNFHDGDGEVAKSLGSSGVPRTILVDSQGKIVFDSNGHAKDELRGAVAKPGHEYTSLAPPPRPNPCLAAK